MSALSILLEKDKVSLKLEHLKNEHRKNATKFDPEKYKLEKLHSNLNNTTSSNSRGQRQTDKFIKLLSKDLKISEKFKSNLFKTPRENVFKHVRTFKRSEPPTKNYKPAKLEKILKKPAQEDSIEKIKKATTKQEKKASTVTFEPDKKPVGVPKNSTSFHSFTHENQSWEEHLLKSLSESTSKWLVLEKTADPIQKQRLAKLMNFKICDHETQLVEEKEPNEEMIFLENSEAERRKAKVQYENSKVEEAGVSRSTLKLHADLTLGNLVQLYNKGLTIDDNLDFLDVDVKGENQTAKFLETSLDDLFTEDKARADGKKFEHIYKNQSIRIDYNNGNIQINDNKYDLQLEAKYPPDSSEKLSKNRYGFRKWMSYPKLHESHTDIKDITEKLKENEPAKDEKHKLPQITDGVYVIIKDWLRSLHFNVSWHAITLQEITDDLMGIHEQQNLQALAYLILAITSTKEIELPTGITNLAKSRTLKLPRYQMMCRLLSIFQTGASIEKLLDDLYERLEIQDQFFLAQFIMMLKNHHVPEHWMHRLISIVTRVFFQRELLSGSSKTQEVTTNRSLFILKNESKKSSAVSNVIVNIAGEFLQSVRKQERCLALDLLKSCLEQTKSIPNCVLQRTNHLLWHDNSIEVRQQACICLEKLNAGQIIYKDLLKNFQNIKKSSERLWCLSVVKRLKIMTAQLLNCFIECFNDLEHADVRILACNVANELNLTSDIVRQHLIKCAQNDTSDSVKAAAINSLSNFEPTKDLIKILTWAATFENKWFVRFSAVSVIGNSEALKLDPDLVQTFRERAIIENHESVKSKIRQLLEDQAGIICNDDDLKELRIIKDQVASLCTKENVLKMFAQMES